MKRIKLLKILQSKSTVFTFKEILLSARGEPAHLLRRRLHYYLETGALIALRRGMYARDQHYDRHELATKIFTPSYVSFETVLAQAGVIFQYHSEIFVASYKSRALVCDKQHYVFRKLKDAILTTTAGLENKGTYFIASKERAFLDMLYLNKDYHFDNLGPLDKHKVMELLPLYNNKRMSRVVQRQFERFEQEG